MSRGAAPRLVAWSVVAAAGAILAPRVAPLDPTVHAFFDALVLGCLAGVAVYVVLARRRPRLRAALAVSRRRVLARSCLLSVKSAQEEAIWRALVLGSLIGPLGRVGALALSTTLFAGAHVGRLGRGAAAHLATGFAFGATYLLTGRLHAAIAAHGTYNVLVGAASLTDQDRSSSDTRRAARPLVASARPVGRPLRIHEHAPPLAAPVASLRGVSKSFATIRALDAVDLELRPGEVLALLGPNGAGKSTAVSIMLGLRRPDDGRAVLFGRDPRNAAARRSIGVVLQEVGFPPALRVRETVELVGAHFPNPASVADALERLGLAELAHRDAGGLSGGQRRRLAVALALAGRPRALFLDEPTAGMDAAARRALLRDVASFARAGGAVLLTTQQLAEAEEIATRVVLIVAGRVVLEGTVAEVRARGGLTKVSLRAASLPPLAGMTSVEAQGDRFVVYVDDSDAFVADLVRSGVAFRELEVAPVSLEDAFVTLTEEAR